MPVLGAPFDYKAKTYMEQRQELTTAQMPLINLDNYPDGYKVYNSTEHKWYELKKSESFDTTYGYFREESGGSGTVDLGVFSSYLEGEQALVNAIRADIDKNNGLETRAYYKFTLQDTATMCMIDWVFTVINFSDIYREGGNNTPSVTLIRQSISGKIEVAENIWLCGWEEVSYVNEQSQTVYLHGLYTEDGDTYYGIDSGRYSVDWKWRDVNAPKQTKFVINDATPTDDQITTLTLAFSSIVNDSERASECVFYIRNSDDTTYSLYSYDISNSEFVLVSAEVEETPIPVLNDEIEFITDSKISEITNHEVNQYTDWIPNTLFDSHVSKYINYYTNVSAGNHTDLCNKTKIFKTITRNVVAGLSDDTQSQINIVTISLHANGTRDVQWRVFDEHTGIRMKTGRGTGNSLVWSAWTNVDGTVYTPPVVDEDIEYIEKATYAAGVSYLESNYAATNYYNTQKRFFVKNDSNAWIEYVAIGDSTSATWCELSYEKESYFKALPYYIKYGESSDISGNTISLTNSSSISQFVETGSYMLSNSIWKNVNNNPKIYSGTKYYDILGAALIITKNENNVKQVVILSTGVILRRSGTINSVNNTIVWNKWSSYNDSYSMNFTSETTKVFLAYETMYVNAIKLMNTGYIKLWVNGVNVLTIPSQENTDSGTVYTYTLDNPYVISEDSEVWWTIERVPDNLTIRSITVY